MAVVIARLRSRRSGYELSTVFALLFGLSLPVEAHNNAVTLGAEPGTIQGQVVTAGPGQVVSAGRGRGHWRTYGVPDGLGGATVWAIFQDRDGYVWLSTDGGGVSRFDGETFISLTDPDDVLARNTVFAIYQDREGHLWFGGDGGAIRYDGEAFATFTTEDGLVDNRVRAIVQDREGYLWFGTEGGASRYDGETFVSFTTEDGLVDNRVWSLLQDREGYLWFGTEGGASRYDGEAFVSFTTEDGLVDNWVRAIVQDREGYLWFGTLRGVSRYDGQTFTTLTTEDGLLDNTVNALYEDREGNLWFGTASESEGRVVRYDGKRFTTFTTQDGLAGDYVNSIVQDREGHLWFGTGGGGVSQYDGQTWTTFTTEDGLPDDDAWSLAQDEKGHVWMGTRVGVSRYDGETFATFTTADGLGDNVAFRMLQDRQGNVWVGSWSGHVSRYDGRTWTTFGPEDGLAHSRVHAFFQDREGYIWIAGTGGASRWNGHAFTTLTTADGLVNNRVLSVFQDREGYLWFGTVGGVSRYDGQTFTSLTQEDGLPRNEVRAIVQDREGHLWFGTAGGVSRYDGERLTTFTTRDGLAHNDVWSLLQDERGHLWIGTEGGGVSRYDGRVFTTLTVKDGLAHNDVRAIMGDEHGNLWFATQGGVTRYRPPESSPPPVFIDAVVADRRYEGVSELEIPSTVGVTVFVFRGISFKTRPEAMIYRYRLRGHDENWQTTHEHRVEYQDLPRGSYLFEVQAVDRDLVYSASPATVALTVHLPYGRVGLLSALGVAVLLIAWQTARVLQRDRRLSLANQTLESQKVQLAEAREEADQANQAKSRFLANMSHEIRTPLNAILGYAQILRRDTETSPAQRRAVDTIQQSGDHLLTLINEVLDLSRIEAGALELHPIDFDLLAVAQGLDAMFRLRCEEQGLTWQVETPAAARLLVHGDEAKLTAVLINLIGNAVKFTAEGRVSLKLTSLPEDRYHFDVSDTGPGIAPDAQTVIFEPFHQTGKGEQKGGTGLGLSIAQRLVELMGGRLDLESTPGAGSRFFFTLHLPAAMDEGVAASAEQWSQVRHLAAGCRVAALVADDVLENREILSRMLTDIGVEVTLAVNGREALEQIQSDVPDIAFLDIRMPEMDGSQVARRIWEELGRDALKVVAVSASALDHERQQFLETGFDRFIPKPVRAEQVYACLADLLQVEYDYASTPTPTPTPTPSADGAEAPAPDWSRIRLPDSLLVRLAKAAELHSVTELERYLSEMDALGADEQHLAAHLRDLSEQYDMDGIRNILKDIRIV